MARYDDVMTMYKLRSGAVLSATGLPKLPGQIQPGQCESIPIEPRPSTLPGVGELQTSTYTSSLIHPS